MADNSRYYNQNAYRRNGYVYGSAVRKQAPERLDVIDYRREKAPAPDPRVSMAARRNRERAAHMNPGYVIFMFVLVSAMCAVLIGYIRLHADLSSSVQYISSLESELSTLKAANDEKYNKINSSISIDDVKYTAITKLGMKYAQKDQVIKYENQAEDYVRQVSGLSD